MHGPELYKALGIALGLGLLVGLQREWRRTGPQRIEDGESVAGIRTFALITLAGGIAGLLGEWVMAGGAMAIAAFFVLGNLARHRKGQIDAGVTTEVAGLVMFLVGGMLTSGYTGPAVVTGGAVAVLLYSKAQLHGLVERIGEKDFRGIIQLVLIALVILPVLPDKAYGPYDVLNPQRIWLMVVLIVGISLTAYAVHRWLGARVGAMLGGVLGGFISSTATTVSYARQARSSPEAVGLATLVILIASAISTVRVLIEIAAVAPAFLREAGPPIAALLAFKVVLCGVLVLRVRGRGGIELTHDNPAQLKPALVFGGLYAVILFIVAAVKANFGSQALYAVAVVSGLTDLDAITLSTANLVGDGQVEPDAGWRVIVVAACSNLAFKVGAAAFLGGRRLGVYVGAVFGACIAAGLAIVLLWP